jgi:glycosyltransferase involved in cell wall biosynthesis
MSHILIIGKVWPEPSSSAAGSRMMQLIGVFQARGWKVSFASAAGDSEYMADLGPLGVEVFKIRLNDAGFDSWIRSLNPAYVMFDRFMTEEQFGWRVAEHCPEAVRVLDTEDLHCLRAGRHRALKENRPFSPEDMFNDLAKREIASIYRCDLSLIISATERRLLDEVFHVNPALLLEIPFLIVSPSVSERQEIPGFADRQDFVSIGNFLHEPNWDAVLFLKQEVWPLIRKRLPGVNVQVYGAYPSHKVFALHNPREGFLVKGRAEAVKPVLSKARVCLAPLRFGAGLKGKLADAMLYGTPSVTTSVGAESMHGDMPWPGLIADAAHAIAGAAVQLFQDEALWTLSQHAGFAVVEKLYTPEPHALKLMERMEAIRHDLARHRSANFIGAMLMQHTALSTRYMALWIEAKNQVQGTSS